MALYRGLGALDARALTYTTMVIDNLGLILTNLSWSGTIIEILRTPNKSLRWILVGVLGSVAVVLYAPFFRELFRFFILSPIDIVICFVVAAVSIAWFEIFKVVRRRYRNYWTV